MNNLEECIFACLQSCDKIEHYERTVMNSLKVIFNEIKEFNDADEFVQYIISKHNKLKNKISPSLEKAF